MREIVFLSGKGGTGKTSITASFAALAQRAVLTDCDVDAADLYLVVVPTKTESHEFIAGAIARIVPDLCRQCGQCEELCQFDAVEHTDAPDLAYRIDPLGCEGCGVCAHFCPHHAIEMDESVCGRWFRSETSFGPMLHAQLGIGAENSGKLVTLLRREAQETAKANDFDLILTDGPPGIGCAALATLTGADYAVYITEPTVSGLHDLKRVAELGAGFRVPGGVVINKADIYPDKAEEIRRFATEHRLAVLGDVPYDPNFTRAQIAGRSIIEMENGAGAAAVRSLWAKLGNQLAIS